MCENLNLTGRIIISTHGINGTVGGALADIKKYLRSTREYSAFKDIDFKWSEGNSNNFPRLSVKVRDEIVTFGVANEIKVDENGIIGGGVHLTPQEVNQLVAERGDEVVFLDGRNALEASIGRFKNAVIPEVNTTTDFLSQIESGKFDHLKDKPIVTYCTGGIRCEVLSLVMKNRGFQEVYQIAGGIVRYGEVFRDSGLWEGSLYVFDARLRTEFSNEAVVIGTCTRCEGPSNDFHNCSNLACRKLTLVCPTCISETTNMTCTDCKT